MLVVIALLSCLAWGNQGDVISLKPIKDEIVFVHEKQILPSSFAPRKQVANCFCCSEWHERAEDKNHISLTPKFGAGNTTIIFDESIDGLEIPKTALTALAFENNFRREHLQFAIGTRFSKKARTTLRVKVLGNYDGGFYRIEVLPTLIEGRKTARASSPEVWILVGNTLTMVEPASIWSHCLL